MAAPSRKLLWPGLGVAALVVVLLYRQFDLGLLLTLESLKNSRDLLVDA